MAKAYQIIQILRPCHEPLFWLNSIHAHKDPLFLIIVLWYGVLSNDRGNSGLVGCGNIRPARHELLRELVSTFDGQIGEHEFLVKECKVDNEDFEVVKLCFLQSQLCR